jgi:ribose-phosphate pyrophosphokinase
MGALSVSCFATHGLFSGKALDNIAQSELDQVIVTNSIPAQQNEEEISKGRVKRLSVAPILAEAIFRIQTKTSISSLFSIPK